MSRFIIYREDKEGSPYIEAINTDTIRKFRYYTELNRLVIIYSDSDSDQESDHEVFEGEEARILYEYLTRDMTWQYDTG